MVVRITVAAVVAVVVLAVPVDRVDLVETDSTLVLQEVP
jgi:hypothetical protein